MGYREITIKDRELFDSYLKKYPIPLSEYTFSNFFAWSIPRKHRYAVIDEHLVVKTKDFFYQPIGPRPWEIIEYLHEEGAMPIKRISKEAAKNLDKAEENRDDFDYLYVVKDLIKLKGSRYEPKRNFIKQCEKYYPTVCKLEEKTVKEFLDMEEKWCNIRDCKKDEGMQAEDMAVREAIKKFKQLGLFGLCVKVNGRIEAFAIGEKLTEDTFVEHFEKANTEFKGMYQFVLHELCKRLKSKFINREQDLGIPGLRKTKLSYHPFKLVKKFKVDM